MRQSRFTEAQIIGMIKEQEAGMPTAEVCRRHGLSPASFYKFKAKYGGMQQFPTPPRTCHVKTGMPPVKWSAHWDMIVPFLGGLNDGGKARETRRYCAEAVSS